MAGSSVVREASEALLRHKEDLARAVTDGLYRSRTDLLDTWGERGRQKCLQDMRYTVEHLAPAVALERPELFVGYVRWLRELLEARDIPADDIRQCLDLMRNAIRDRLEPDHAFAAAGAVEAGLAVLPEASL